MNVLVGDDLRAVLTDFGLSITLDDIRTRSASNTTRSPQGTLRWMAPECLDGGRSSKAADVYALGITIWEVSVAFDMTSPELYIEPRFDWHPGVDFQRSDSVP